MKKLLAFILVGVALSCVSFAVGTKDKVLTNKKIGLVISTLNNPFFVSLKYGVEKKCAELGLELIVLDSQNSAAKELSNVQQLINKGVNVILLNPNDSYSVGQAIEEANKANIPIITLDRNSNSGKVATHIASDNIAGGKMAGQYIITKLGVNKNIVVLEGLFGTSAAKDRGKGFNMVIDKKEKIIAKVVADFDRAKGQSAMEQILKLNLKIDAVFAHNDEMALGAINAIKASGKKIMVVGFDATDDALVAIQTGTMSATIAQQPELIGLIGVEFAVKIIKGEKVESFVPVALKLISK